MWMTKWIPHCYLITCRLYLLRSYSTNPMGSTVTHHRSLGSDVFLNFSPYTSRWYLSFCTLFPYLPITSLFCVFISCWFPLTWCSKGLFLLRMDNSFQLTDDLKYVLLTSRLQLKVNPFKHFCCTEDLPGLETVINNFFLYCSLLVNFYFMFFSERKWHSSGECTFWELICWVTYSHRRKRRTTSCFLVSWSVIMYLQVTFLKWGAHPSRRQASFSCELILNEAVAQVNLKQTMFTLTVPV